MRKHNVLWGLILMVMTQVKAQQQDTLLVDSLWDKINFSRSSQPTTLKLGSRSIQIDDLSVKTAHVINGTLSDGGSILLQRDHETAKGYIVSYEGEFAYKLERTDQGDLLLETNLDDLIPNDKKLKIHGHERAYVYSDETLLPIGNNLSANALALESRAGASTTIFLDFDGEDISGWGYNFPEVYASNYTDDQIRKVWEVIAADLLMFDVNVTTNIDVFNSYLPENRMKCIFGVATGLQSVGGKSLVDIFGTGSGPLVNSANGDKGVETAHIGSHEIGHALGLLHDGTMWPGPSIPYYEGHADWAPIMGYTYGKKLVTWCKGEYEFASQAQDDLAIIGNNLGYATDDHTGIQELTIGAGDTLNTVDNYGVIESSLDVDTFQFEMVDTGNVQLNIGTAVLHTNLDVQMDLLDSNFQLISSKNPILNRTATIDTVLFPGKYYLLIISGHENGPNDGFTNYSSFGYYDMYGVIDGLKRPDFDLAINEVSGFDNLCGESTSGTVTVKNNGDSLVSSANLNIYLDEVLMDIQPIGSLGAGATFLSENIEFASTGHHQIRFEVVAGQNLIERVLNNNEVSIHYTFENGNLIEVTTNHPEFTGSAPFEWNVYDQTTTLFSGSSVELFENNGLTTQSFCLLSECYDFELTGDFNLCSAFPDHVSGGTYSAGDQVHYNGAIYKAKWWNTNLPTSSAWEKIKDCNSGNYIVELKDVSNDTVLVALNNDSLQTTATQSAFCINAILTGEAGFDFEKVSVYPNPTTDYFIIENLPTSGKVYLVNSVGKVVFQRYVNSESIVIDTSELATGVYFLQTAPNSPCIKVLVNH